MVSNIFYFHPYLGKIPILTNIFQMGWNHQGDSSARWPLENPPSKVTFEWKGSRKLHSPSQKGHVFAELPVYFGLPPFPVIGTTRIITFLVGNPYKPSFPLLLGRGTTQSLLLFQIKVLSPKILPSEGVGWDSVSRVARQHLWPKPGCVICWLMVQKSGEKTSWGW